MAEQPTTQLIEDLRTLIRDKPEFNRILETRENRELSDAELSLALRLGLSEFNATAPKTSFKFANIPEYMLLMASLLQAALILGLGHTRNEFNYTSGGVSIRVFDKTPHYQNWFNILSSKYERHKYDFKIANNINTSLGVSVPSEYSSVSFTLL
jgi:hypothetical protein